jgi:hypothetical protein
VEIVSFADRYADEAAALLAAVHATVVPGVVEWARRNGFETCGAEWTSANLVSDAFWRGHGFTPIRSTLARWIDPRIAWAGPQLSYPGR